MSEYVIEITDEQKQKFLTYADKWIKVGLCTELADRTKAEEGINLSYKLKDLRPPQRIVWCQSPYAMGLIIRRCLKVQEKDTSPGFNGLDEILDEVQTFIKNGETDESKLDMVDPPLVYCGYGQHNAVWLCFFEFFRDENKLSQEEIDKVEGARQIALAAGWYVPFDNICFVTERPTVVSLDDRKRLHSETGPSIAYPDGWELHFFRGIKVTKQLIEAPETITGEQIMNEENAEIKRLMIDRFGPANFMKAIGAKPVQKDEFGELYKTELKGDRMPLALVRVINGTMEDDGTFKEYWLQVPPETKTAKGGVAATYGLSEDQYHPQIRT